MVDRFQGLDDNGDAAVSAEEFEVPFANVVRRLDRNDDGEITHDELRQR
jgi:Ca2+-binding EF-hand superfamily protein